MKILLSWLKEYIPLNLGVEEISQTLTNIGLEVEEVKTINAVKGGLEGLIIGKVLEAVQHPNADRLRITKVDIGQENFLQIVCGAPNVAAGQKVVVATVGTTVFPTEGESFLIKNSKIRGEVSEGMICAEDEIGLGSNHEGIMILDDDAPIGTLLSKHLKLENDYVFEIGLTPNRIDAASHIGVARDLAAFYKLKVDEPLIKSIFQNVNTAPKFEVEVMDKNLAPRYSTLVVENITVSASPAWLQKRLFAIGINPINNIVDITNYVMHETGQPLHAFDKNQITGNKIIVRNAVQNAEFVTLDGVSRKMQADDLMICNQETMMCIAGVYGGKHSGITSNTTSIVLESAFFNPVSIRKTSRLHNLKTDASFRFERKTDIEATIYAIKRAADLIVEHALGKVASSISDFYPDPQPATHVSLSRKKLDNLIGQHIERAEVSAILIGLGFTILTENDLGWELSVPTSKTDVLREADVVEEILRIYGYDNIRISGKLIASLSPSAKPDKDKFLQKLANDLCNVGFAEIMNLSFSAKSEDDKSISLLNPLSVDLAIMRTSLIPGALDTIVYNQNRRQLINPIFEIGKIYLKNQNSYSEVNQVLMILPEINVANWKGNRKNDFYSLKGILEGLFLKAGIKNYDQQISDVDDVESVLRFSLGKINLGTCGAIPSTLLKEKGIEQKLFYALLNTDEMIKGIKTELKFKEIAKFPSVRRDLSMLVNEEVNFEQLRSIALQTGKRLIKEVGIFDVYRNDPKAVEKKLPQGKKSYALSFILEDSEKTLTDTEIDATMNKLIASLEKQTGAEIRKA